MKIFKKKSKGIPVFMIVSFAVLLAYALSLIIPLIWSGYTSLKDWIAYAEDPVGLPKKWKDWHWDNYKAIFKAFKGKKEIAATGQFVNVGIPTMLLNSVWYAFGTSACCTLVSLLVGYVVARFNFKFCGWIYAIVIFQMIIPAVGTMPSELRMATNLHLYNTVYGMLFMKSYVSGLYFLSFYAALKVIPKDYTEAAYLDGAGNFSVMVKIMFPMVTGVITSVFLLNFIAFWNDYQTPILYMPSFPTLSYGLYHCTQGSFMDNVPYRLGACMMLALPLLLLFLVFQKKLLGNVSLGGLK